MLNPPHPLPTPPRVHAWMARSAMAFWSRAHAASSYPSTEALTPMPS
jgi:hypothetical protein